MCGWCGKKIKKGVWGGFRFDFVKNVRIWVIVLCIWAWKNSLAEVCKKRGGAAIYRIGEELMAG